AAAITQALADLGASDKDLALTQGASGGDLLFAEAAVARGMKVQLLLPLPEPDFIAQSILPATGGDGWRKRYYQLRNNPLCLPPRVMPDELGPLPQDSRGKETNPFERCNQWLLNSALALGIKRTRCLCLWNGSGGDGPGGTEHMMKEVKKRTGQVTWLDTRTMW
ncbi:MAG TPA: tetratricopeptide repeat protein, partial [Zoogloea sp.]|nr:tetratricopeptide repeat protein [Zoogloea sp.]